MSATFPSLNIKKMCSDVTFNQHQNNNFYSFTKTTLIFLSSLYPVVLQIIKENQRQPILREKRMLN